MSVMTSAHPLDVIYFEINQKGISQYNVCFNIHPDPLKVVLNSTFVDEALLSKEPLVELLKSENVCTGHFLRANFLENDVHVCYEYDCAATSVNQDMHLSIKFSFLNKLKDNFKIIGKNKINDQEKIFTSDKTNQIYNFEAQNISFFYLGLEHIGATFAAWTDDYKQFKVADGIDHILFVLALLLVSVSWRELLVNITGFTLGHSISLGLSLTQILRLPPLYIEPAIAGSIVYLAFVGVLNRQVRKSFFITLSFGFLHGMGFSYVLGELKIKSLTDFLNILLSFNLGIEAGQLIIITLLVPLFYCIHKYPVSGLIIKKVFTLIVFCISIFWFIERTSKIFQI